MSDWVVRGVMSEVVCGRGGREGSEGRGKWRDESCGSEEMGIEGRGTSLCGETEM